MKPKGTEMMAGLVSGKMGSIVMIGVAGGSGFGPVNTLGLRMTSTTAEIRPSSMPVIAPVVLNLFQKIVSRMTGTWSAPGAGSFCRMASILMPLLPRIRVMSASTPG
jgi:hypothetical protein